MTKIEGLPDWWPIIKLEEGFNFEFATIWNSSLPALFSQKENGEGVRPTTPVIFLKRNTIAYQKSMVYDSERKKETTVYA